MFTQLSLATRKAGKSYRCIWCWQLIKKGEGYIREASVYDGEFQDFKWHPECKQESGRIANEEGGLIEWVSGMERPPKEYLNGQTAF